LDLKGAFRFSEWPTALGVGGGLLIAPTSRTLAGGARWKPVQDGHVRSTRLAWYHHRTNPVGLCRSWPWGEQVQSTGQVRYPPLEAGDVKT
jgi:hypothetical protein